MKKTNKKRYLKKGLEKFLIFMNCLSFVIIASINDYKDFKTYLLILLVNFSIIFLNSAIISKYGRLLKED